MEWKKQEGEEVAAGDLLCIIETLKATWDYEAENKRFLAKILVGNGSKDVREDSPIAIVVESAEDIPKFASYGSEGEASAEAAAGPLPPSATPAPCNPSPESFPLPLLPPEPSKSTPPASGAPPPAHGAYEDLPNSQIRKVIARRLLESKVGTPHYYLAAGAPEAVIDETLLLRKVLKEKHSKAISVNDFIIKAVAAALKEVPEANASCDEATGEVRLNSNVDICVAVATDQELMTPIVKGADAKSLSAISAEVKALEEKARSGKLKPEEFTGGTFTISNLGMFPVDRFNAIINPPQAGILAIGRCNKVAVWEEGPNGTGAPATVTKMEVTLSGDHRVMDGDEAGRFLQAVVTNLTDLKKCY